MTPGNSASAQTAFGGEATLASFSIAGKTAVVTGGGGGIGSALCLGLASAGANIVVIEHPGRSEPTELTAQIRALGRRCDWVAADLAQTDALPALVRRIWSEAGGIDILVNNAGVSTLSWFCDQDLETWKRTMAVNLDAPYALSVTTAECMIENGRAGRIVMISSKNGQVAEQGLLAYNTSKAGLEMLAKSLAVELGRWDITVNSVSPGMIETAMADDFDLDWPAFRRYYEEHIPSRIGFATPDDVVGAVLLLSSPAGRYITGQSIVVDGGVLAQQLPRAQFMPPMRLARRD